VRTPGSGGNGVAWQENRGGQGTAWASFTFSTCSRSEGREEGPVYAPWVGGVPPPMSTAVRWSPARSPGVAGALIVMGSQVLAGVVALGVIDTLTWVLATQSVTGIFVALWLVARRTRVTLAAAASLLLPRLADLRGTGGIFLAMLASLVYKMTLDLLGICTAAPPPEVHELFLSPYFWVNPVILAPIVEELTFRGFLFDSLLKWGRTTAVIVSALVATLVHGYLPQIVAILPSQLILSYARAGTNEVTVCILFHSLSNSAVLVAVLCMSSLVGN